MNETLNRALLRRPWVSVAVALGAVLVLFGAVPAGLFDESGPAWLTWGAVGLMAYGAALAFGYPRIVRRSPADVHVVTFIAAMSPVLYGYVAAGFGAPLWVLTTGMLLTAVSLAGVTRVAVAAGGDG